MDKFKELIQKLWAWIQANVIWSIVGGVAIVIAALWAIGRAKRKASQRRSAAKARRAKKRKGKRRR